VAGSRCDVNQNFAGPTVVVRMKGWGGVRRGDGRRCARKQSRKNVGSQEVEKEVFRPRLRAIRHC